MSSSLCNAVQDAHLSRGRHGARALTRLAILLAVSAMLVLVAAAPAFALATLDGSLMRLDRVTCDDVDNLWPAGSDNRIAWVTGGDLYSQVQTRAPQLLASNVTTAPFVSGDRVTWIATGGSDAGADYEVFTWTEQTGVVQLTQDIFNQQRLAVSGDRIAWMSPTVVTGPLQVWTWTPTEPVHMLTHGERNMRVDVSGDRVVWQGQGGAGLVTTDSEVFTWTAADNTITQVTNNDRTDHSIVVGGDMISWESTGGIPSAFEYDDGTDEEVWAWTPFGGLFQLTLNGRDDVRAVTSGERVAWLGRDTTENGGDFDVYTWSPFEGTRQITADAAEQTGLCMSSTMLAWLTPNLGEQNELYVWDLAHPELGIQYPLYCWPIQGTMKLSGSRIVFTATYPGPTEGGDLEVLTMVPDGTEPGSISGTLYTPGCTGPAAGVRVELCDADWNILDTTMTAGNGFASFPSVTPGTYNLRWVDPSNRWATMYYLLGSTRAEADNLIVWSGQATDIDQSLLRAYTPDVTAPQTTTTATAQWHPAPYDIRLEATDDSDAPVTTYYKWYTTDPSTGTTRTLTANPIMVNSDGVRYLEYWSVDAAGNEELPHNTLKVSIDSLPPVTSTDARGHYVESAAIHLSAEDTAGVSPYTGTVTSSGVALTLWRLDDSQMWTYTTQTVTAGVGHHTLHYYSFDNAGITEAEQTVSFTVDAAQIDNTPPHTSTTATADWHPAPYDIRLFGTDDSQDQPTVYYKWYTTDPSTGTTRNAPSNPAVVPANSDGRRFLEYWSVDLAGNEEVPHHTLAINIDSVAPTTTCNARQSYIGTATITFSAEDSAGVYPYTGTAMPSGVAGTIWRLDNGEWSSEPTVTVRGDDTWHKLHYYSFDYAMNMEAEKTFDFRPGIDLSHPYTVTTSTADWHTGPYYIYLKSRDAWDAPETLTTYYRWYNAVSSGATQTYDGNGVYVHSQGVRTFEYWAVDPSGNEEEPHNTLEVKLDSAAPSITPVVNSDRSPKVTVSIAATDVVSGVAQLSYRIDSEATITLPAGVDSTMTPEQTKLGQHTIKIVARDVAGNEAVKTTTFDVVSAPPSGGGGGGSGDSGGAADTEPPVTTAMVSESGWTKNPVHITLSATDTASGVKWTWFYWKSGTGAYPAEQALYGTGILGMHLDGNHTLYYWSDDNAGNSEAPHSLAVQIDTLGPVVSDFAYHSLTASSISLSWSGWDAGCGVDYYLFGDGTTTSQTTGTTKALTGLTPGRTYTFTIAGVDKLGNLGYSRSITIKMPASWTSAMIPAAQLATATIAVPPGGDGTTLTADVAITGVTSPGELTIVRTPTPPSSDGGGLEVLGQYYDVNFTGTFTGALTITLPYDSRIPDSRAKQLVLRHFTQAGVWETLETHVNTLNHTITGVLHSLSPIAIAETTATVTTVTVESRPTQADGSFIAPYRGRGQVIVRVRDASDNGVSGMTLVARDGSGSVVATFAPLATRLAATGVYAAKLPIVSNSTTFAVTLEPNEIHFVADPVVVVVRPCARLLAPTLPVLPARSGKAFTVSGRLLPAHAGVVRVVAYRIFGTKLVRSATVTATTSATGSFKAKLNLKRGYYRFIAYHSDSDHAATTSPRSRILLVR